MLKEKLTNLKKKKIWFLFLLYFVNPFYTFIWKNIINLHGRILYFIWFIKKREFIDLSKEDVLKVENSKSFQLLSEQVNRACTPEILNLASKNIFDLNTSSLFHHDNPSNSEGNKYFEQIYDLIDKECQKKIVDFAKSELLISTAAKYLGVFPVLSKIILTYTVPRNIDLKRGAMLFHKDDKGFKSLDLFLNITDIDEFSGPLKILKTKYDMLGPFASVDSSSSSTLRGNRGKLSDSEVYKKFNNKEEFISIEGKRGTGTFVDSFKHYHAGGHCIKKNRILLRLLYATIDCAVLPELNNNAFPFYEELKKENVKNMFLKFFYFKRSNLFKNKKN